MSRDHREGDVSGHLPADAHHRYYGNPTASHPDVVPLFRNQFGDEPLKSILAKLGDQRTVSRESPEYAGEPGGTYSVVATSLPVIRPHEIEPGLLIYHPEPNPHAVIEIREEPSTTDDTSDELVTTLRYEIVEPFGVLAGNTPEIVVNDESLSVRDICDGFTFLVPDGTQLPGSELRS
ncbi:hypothetical protein [Haloferax volcanii]|uniref:hypothetical protein n=1 Tax=Haloferax volcanii TaxID=2246 RepID=UPI003D3027D8